MANKWSKIGELLTLTAAGMSDPTGLIQRMSEAEKAKKDEEDQQKYLDWLSKNNGNVTVPLSGGAQANVPVNVAFPQAGMPATQYSPMEGTEMGKMLGQTPESKLEQGIYKEGVVKEMEGRKWSEQQLKEKYGEAGRVVQAFRNLAGYGAEMDKMNMGTTQRQVMSKMQGITPYLPADIQDKLSPLLNYNAQETEVRLGLLPILSGQARYVVELAKAIAKTVPSAGMTPKNRKGLIGQSVRNTLSLVYGVQNGHISADKLSEMGIDPNSGVSLANGELPDEAKSLLNSVKLTSDQEKAIEEAVDYVTGADPLIGGKKSKDDDSEKLKSLGLDPNKYEIVR